MRDRESQAATLAVVSAVVVAVAQVAGEGAQVGWVARYVPPPTPARPGVAALPALAAQTGLDVSVTVTGQPRPVPADVEATAYRLVREALTNVVRHAAAAEAEVWLGYEPASLVVEVLDRGRGGEPGPGGHGLAGMRERVAALGGELVAGPRADGGFRVRARLPLAAT